MFAVLGFMLIFWVVLVVLGLLIKGLLWLTVAGAVAFLVTAALVGWKSFDDRDL